MMTLRTASDVRQWREGHDNLGFVPTMGALHGGHLQLIERSKFECDKTLVSVFVNPTQFNNPNDLKSYPRDVDRDLGLLRGADVDAIFLPDAAEIYSDNYRYRVSESEVAKILCGAYRPGHFDGVLTVMMKLLNIVRPQRCFMGEKDYQQLLLVNEMARAFFLESVIVACPTVREADGLAMSSRNQLLSAEDREIAPHLYHSLKSDRPLAEISRDLENSGFTVEYLEEHFGRRFVAAHLGGVRLIDNVAI